MGALEAIIKKLCIDCSRRNNVCGEHPPDYLDAYRCKYDEAVKLLSTIKEHFPL